MKKIIGFIITILAMCSFAFCNIESKEVVYASGEEEAVFNTPELSVTNKQKDYGVVL